MGNVRGWLGVITAVGFLAGCSTPSEIAIGQSLLIWALPLFALTVVVERVHAWLTFRKALSRRPRQSWVGVAAAGVVLAGLALPIVTSTKPQHLARHETLAAFTLFGYVFYLGSALLLVGRQTEPLARLCAVVLPITLVAVPGAILALFGSSDPLHNGLLWITIHLIMVSPVFIGPPVLLCALVVAIAQPYRPIESIPKAQIIRWRRHQSLR